MADDFDPERYLKEKQAAVSAAPDFDPERYLAEKTGVPRAAPKEEPVTLGAVPTGAMHFNRHFTFGLGDKLTAALQALGDVSHDRTGKVTFGDAYNRDLAFNDKLTEASDQAHPVARWMGNGLGVTGGAFALGLPNLVRGMAGAAAPELAAPGLARVLQGVSSGAKTGLFLGGVGGYGSSRADSPLGTAADTGIGGLGGLVLGGALGGLGGGLSSLLARRASAQPVTPYANALEEAKGSGQLKGLPFFSGSAEPTPAAQTLQRYGVPLTLRQLSPDGPLAEISESSERVPFLGRAVQAQEKAPLEAWRDVALRQAMPGEGPMVSGPTADKLGDIQGQISALYQQVEGAPAKIAAVHPETGELVNPTEAFKAILKDPNYQAGDSDLRIVHGVMKDQLGKLYRATDGGKSITAGTLMNMRSALRQAGQDAMQEQGGFARAQMFNDAAESLTGGLKASLPPQDLAALSTADAAYSKFSRLANASLKAGNQIGEGDFSPQRLSAELTKAYGRKFATDSEAGGSLRELATAGKQVFTPRDPHTGHGETLKSLVGMTLGPLVYRANASPAAQAALTAVAQKAATGGGAGMSPAVASEFEQLLSGLLQRQAAGAAPPGTLSSEATQGLVSALRRRTEP